MPAARTCEECALKCFKAAAFVVHFSTLPKHDCVLCIRELGLLSSDINLKCFPSGEMESSLLPYAAVMPVAFCCPHLFVTERYCFP